MAPKLSILMQTLNCKPYITETFDSVLKQTFTDWEWIISDGKSSDGTIELIQSYAKNDARIKVVSEKDNGPWHAFEKSLSRAKGEYITMICGQDSYTDPTWLENAISILEKNKDISLVWALGREKSDAGISDTNDSYRTFLKRRNKIGIIVSIIKKCLYIFRHLLFGTMMRKRFLLKKLFSTGAALRARSFMQRGFNSHEVPHRIDWFLYWLKTGLVFPDQSFVISRRVFLECIPPPGSNTKFDSFTDFFFNFNSRGYLAYHIPRYVHANRAHSDASGSKHFSEIESESISYLNKIASFRKDVLNHMPVSFHNRDGDRLFTYIF